MAGDIFAAISNSDRQAVEKLLAGDSGLARSRNAAGVSAVMQARYEGRHEIVQLLRQSAGELDVFEAATLGDAARLKALLAADAGLARAYSRDGFTALHLACFFGQPQAADLLLSGGADANAVSQNTMKVAVIHSAAASGRADVVKLVLRGGADPNARQTAGYTALQAAAAHDNVEMAQALLDAGADPALRSDDGQTALDKAGAAVAELLKSRT